MASCRLPCDWPGEAAIIISDGGLGLEGQRLGVVGDGAVEVAVGLAREAAVAVGAGQRRVDADRLGEVGDGAIEVVLGRLGVAAGVVGGGQAGIDGDGLAEVGDGAVEIILGRAGAAPALEGDGHLRVEGEGLGVILDRIVELAAGLARGAARDVGPGGTRVDAQRLGEVDAGALPVVVRGGGLAAVHVGLHHGSEQRPGRCAAGAQLDALELPAQAGELEVELALVGLDDKIGEGDETAGGRPLADEGGDEVPGNVGRDGLGDVARVEAAVLVDEPGDAGAGEVGVDGTIDHGHGVGAVGAGLGGQRVDLLLEPGAYGGEVGGGVEVGGVAGAHSLPERAGGLVGPRDVDEHGDNEDDDGREDETEAAAARRGGGLAGRGAALGGGLRVGLGVSLGVRLGRGWLGGLGLGRRDRLGGFRFGRRGGSVLRLGCRSANGLGHRLAITHGRRLGRGELFLNRRRDGHRNVRGYR